MKTNSTKAHNFGARGWILILFGIICLFCNNAGTSDGLNVALPAIAEGGGLDYSTALGVGTIAGFVGVVAMFIIGAIRDKIGSRRMAGILMIIFGLAFYFLFLRATNIGMYTAAECIMVSCGQGTFFLCMGSLQASWFPKKRGVVAGIMPWNFPLFLIGRKVAPALIAGDTVVLKPSSDTPNGAYEFAKLVENSSLPAGVINVITGSGAVVGDTLARYPKVAMVSMTGSTEAGKKIMAAASENIAKISLELGGKAPVIIMDDCKVDETVEHVFNSRFINCGQACNCAERVYVQEGVYPEFIEKLTARIKAAKYGSPLDASNDIGPMINAKQADHVDELVKSAVAEGATLVCGGNKASVDGKGYFYEPTLLTGCTHDMRIMKEEIFGPALPITTFATLDEAIEKANDCVYGLTSSIYTQNMDVMMRALNEIHFYETLKTSDMFFVVRLPGLVEKTFRHGKRNML